jgi:hypothetical protein
MIVATSLGRVSITEPVILPVPEDSARTARAGAQEFPPVFHLLAIICG